MERLDEEKINKMVEAEEKDLYPDDFDMKKAEQARTSEQV